MELLLNFFNDRHYLSHKVSFGWRYALFSAVGLQMVYNNESVQRARTAGCLSWYIVPLLTFLLTWRT